MLVLDALTDDDRPDGGLVEHVMRHVNAHIRDNGLKRGAAVPSEGAIAEAVGVSRAVVREAFRSLATLGILEVGSGRRARVGSIDAGVLPLVLDHAVRTDQVSIQQIYDVRRTIEMRTVTLAALRRTDQEAASILAHAEAMRRDASDHPRIMEHDIAFHEAIAGACRNPLFGLLVASFHVITRQTWGIGWNVRTAAEREESLACHARIARAIAASDARAAEAAMADHFDHSIRTLISAGVV